jgi:hypothetical protein
VLVVASDSRRAWRAALPFVLLALVFGVPSLLDGDVGFGSVVVVVAIGVGGARAALWYYLGDDSLWDDGVYLIWARGGRVVSRVAWDQVKTAGITSSVLPPEWSLGRYKGGPSLPEVFVSTRTPPEGNVIDHGVSYVFATLVLIRSAQVLAAEAQLAAACKAHGVGSSRSSSGWGLPSAHAAAPDAAATVSGIGWWAWAA